MTGRREIQHVSPVKTTITYPILLFLFSSSSFVFFWATEKGISTDDSEAISGEKRFVVDRIVDGEIVGEAGDFRLADDGNFFFLVLPRETLKVSI